MSLPEIAINFGIMLGFVADYAFLPLPPSVNWRLMLGLGVVMPTILIILTLTVMPESPRWLLFNGRWVEQTAFVSNNRRDITIPDPSSFSRLRLTHLSPFWGLELRHRSHLTTIWLA